jgi:hypothetical protein
MGGSMGPGFYSFRVFKKVENGRPEIYYMLIMFYTAFNIIYSVNAHFENEGARKNLVHRFFLAAYPPATSWFLSLLIFDYEEGADTLLRNVGSNTGYTALYPRRRQHS